MLEVGVGLLEEGEKRGACMDMKKMSTCNYHELYVHEKAVVINCFSVARRDLDGFEKKEQSRYFLPCEYYFIHM